MLFLQNITLTLDWDAPKFLIQFCNILKLNNKLEEDTKEKYKHRYLYYLAKSKKTKGGIGLKFEYLYFHTESDQYIVPEQVIGDFIFHNGGQTDCCVCIKAALSEDGYARILSSEIYFIYFIKNDN